MSPVGEEPVYGPRYIAFEVYGVLLLLGFLLLCLLFFFALGDHFDTQSIKRRRHRQS